jgi:hypothetical protein
VEGAPLKLTSHASASRLSAPTRMTLSRAWPELSSRALRRSSVLTRACNSRKLKGLVR